MAPVNGAAPSKPARTAARHITTKVVPVLPLNYPQRPVAKRPSAPPKSSPLAAEMPPRQLAADQEQEHKPAETTQPHDPILEKQNKREEPAPATNGSILTSPIAPTGPAQPMEASPEPVAPAPALSTGTPTVIAAPSVASPTPTRPSGSANVTVHGPTLNGTARRAHIPVSHPPLPFRPAFHQAHPSTGSMVLGGLHDSNASSPAPNSVSGFPPPNMAPPFYPPVDGYGHPAMGARGFDAFPPTMNHHGPPTPHSFHGSQSSAQAGDDHSLWHISSSNNYLENSTEHGQMQTPFPTQYIPPPLALSNGPSSLHQNFDTLGFIRSGVDDTEFNDCLLEVHFHDAGQYRDHPDHSRLVPFLRLRAHRFILSHSPLLTNLMRAQRVESGGTIVLDVRGDYLRSDVFYYIIRALYGWSIDPRMPPSDLGVRNVKDDFKLALSYLETSDYLQLGPMLAGFVDRASALLCWDTVEMAAGFVLPRAVLSSYDPAEGQLRYADSPIIPLTMQVLRFVSKHFPRNFVLDTDAGNCGGFSRLPPLSPASPAQSPTSPPIANGSTSGFHRQQSSSSQAVLARNRPLATNPRLTQLKFGDVSPSERSGRVPSAPSLTDTILSRILLNLPYPYLKRVLEDANLGSGSGGEELEGPARLAIITDIIAERESRRLRSLDQSQPHLHIYQETLEKAGKAPLRIVHVGDFLVNSMGYKEEVCPGDVPFLVHAWTGSNPGSVSG